MISLPSFSLPASDGKTYTEKDFQKGVFLLYLYPKDMTPGCTSESIQFRDALSFFQEKGVSLFGLSPDSLSRHQKFIEKYNFPFSLLSDEDHVLIEKLDAWKEKKFMGRTYMGTERSTFLIRDGSLIKEWRKVKVKNHIEEIKAYLETLI